MGNLLYVIAVILVIGWAIGFIGFHVGGIIHILLVIALISVILRVIQGRQTNALATSNKYIEVYKCGMEKCRNMGLILKVMLKNFTSRKCMSV